MLLLLWRILHKCFTGSALQAATALLRSNSALLRSDSELDNPLSCMHQALHSMGGLARASLLLSFMRQRLTCGRS